VYRRCLKYGNKNNSFKAHLSKRSPFLTTMEILGVFLWSLENDVTNPPSLRWEMLVVDFSGQFPHPTLQDEKANQWQLLNLVR